MRKPIQKVAVLGAGVMGVRIACHLAHTCTHVLLLDLPQKTKGKTASAVVVDPAKQQLTQVLKDKLSPLYLPDFAARIQTGNFVDDMPKIADCEWIIEAVVEELDVKKQLYEQVERHRKPGTFVSSNTSGIPLQALSVGRSGDFQKHFFGTHFFNPPRYLPLLEFIPGPKTAPEILPFFRHYGTYFLGKEVLLCKDRPAFVSNRIGMFNFLNTLSAMQVAGLSIGEVDALTGPLIGRSRSATFRTLDLVGVDVFMKVAEQLYKALPEDEKRDILRVPTWINTLYKKGYWGAKRGQGFYKKIKSAKGTEIEELDPATGNYASKKRTLFAEVEALRGKDDVLLRLRGLLALEGRIGDFFRQLVYGLFAYCSHRIPEVADDVYTLDTAMRAGFGWDLGPFELWEGLGVDKVCKAMQVAGHVPAAWVQAAAAKSKAFYSVKDHQLQVYVPEKAIFTPISGKQAGKQDLILLRTRPLLWENDGAKLYDLGDGVLCLATFSKMNILNADVIAGLHIAIERAEKEGHALVIGHEGPQFSAGADISLLLAYALEQEYEEIDLLVKEFQQIMLRMRYAAVPVVAATRGLTLGGGCELIMHTDQVQAHAETYIGLVEMGVGLIPAGGGTKEMAARLSAALVPQDVAMNRLQTTFKHIATAEVSTSAHQGKKIGYLRATDTICMSAAQLLLEAKRSALRLIEAGYVPPIPQPIHVQGSAGIALLEAGIADMLFANYATEHDAKIARKLSHVLNGGPLSAPTAVREDYLLDLEREAFLSLCSEEKTLARMEHLLRKGKPLRN